MTGNEAEKSEEERWSERSIQELDRVLAAEPVYPPGTTREKAREFGLQFIESIRRSKTSYLLYLLTHDRDIPIAVNNLKVLCLRLLTEEIDRRFPVERHV